VFSLQPLQWIVVGVVAVAFDAFAYRVPAR
jgi:hypothetical protein